MSMTLIENWRAKLDSYKQEMKFIMMGGGLVRDFTIETIPDEWTHFEGSVADEWKRLKMLSDETNGTACLYKGKVDSKFPAHKHPFQTELLTIENESGNILVVTPTYSKEYVYGDSIFFDKDEPHIVLFLTDTVLLCRWRPRFKNDGWNAKI